MEEATGLNKRQQYRLVEKLEKIGLITTKNKETNNGNMERKYYYLNHEEVKKLVAETLVEKSGTIEKTVIVTTTGSGSENDPEGTENDPGAGSENNPAGSENDPGYNNNKNNNNLDNNKNNNKIIHAEEKITVEDIPIQVEGVELKITQAGNIKY